MKAMSRTIIYKAMLASLLLLLLQSNGIAQEYDTTVVSIDTTYSSDTTYISDSEDDSEEETPDTPVFRKVPDSSVKRLQSSDDFAYANDPEYWIKEKPKQVDNESWLDWLFRQKWLKWVVLAIMSGTLMYALVKIAISNRLVLFRGTPTATQFSEETDLLEKDNLPALITQAEQAGNHRLAVRYWYMKILQDMSKRKLIQLDVQSTNWEYVNKLGSHPAKKQFQFLTRVYEYVWYGEFVISAEQYGHVKTSFQQFENSL